MIGSPEAHEGLRPGSHVSVKCRKGAPRVASGSLPGDCDPRGARAHAAAITNLIQVVRLPTVYVDASAKNQSSLL